jgi:hypothetical protein
MPPESPPAELVDALGYVRMSKMREEAISPETQRSAIEACAKRLGFRIVDVIEDLGQTGRSFGNRKILKAIDQVADGKAAAIIVWKYSRFGRSRKGNAIYLARLEDAGGQLVSATEDFDVSTATGKLNRGVVMEFDAFYSDLIGETWAETHRYRIGHGLPAFGRPRFGYRRLGRVQDDDHPERTRHVPGEKERYEIDPDEGAVLAGMYRDSIAGTGFGMIARSLNADGWRTAFGNEWGVNAVRDVLDSGFGAGLLILHDPACRCRNKTKCRRKVYVPGAHVPVIEATEWERYLERRARTKTMPPRLRVPRYPVSGLVRCGHCHGPMSASSPGEGGAITFKCQRYVKQRDCEGRTAVTVTRIVEAARDFAAELADDIDRAAREAPLPAKRRGLAPTAFGAAEEKLAKAERELVRLARQRAQGDEDIPDSIWKEAAVQARKDRDEAAAALEALRKRERDEEVSREIPALLPSLLDDWDTLPASALNEILRKLMRRIVVYRTGERSRGYNGRMLPIPAKFEIHPTWEPDPWLEDQQ